MGENKPARILPEPRAEGSAVHPVAVNMTACGELAIRQK